MGFESLFIRTRKSLGPVELDAVLTEAHTNSVTMTTNPIESGASVTDHAVIEPKQLSITAIVSDTPIGLASLGEIIDQVTHNYGTSTEQNITRGSVAYNDMVTLMEQRELLEVQTELKLYQNMLITSLSTAQDKNTSRAVNMAIELREALITESEIVQLEEDQLGTPTKEQALPSKDNGRKETVTPDDGRSKSYIKTGIDWLFGE